MVFGGRNANIPLQTLSMTRHGICSFEAALIRSVSNARYSMKGAKKHEIPRNIPLS